MSYSTSTNYSYSSTTSAGDWTIRIAFGAPALPQISPLELKIAAALKVLGLTPESKIEETKAAYRKLAKQWHPDRGSAEEREERTRKMAEINAAYEFLELIARRAA